MTTQTVETAAEEHWTRWVMQTARNWDDIADVVKRTDIDTIDDDHQKLTELTLQINNLLDAAKEGQFSLAAIQQQRHILESIYAYAEHHFHREEELIEQLGLPDLERQRQQHGVFMDMLRTALDDFNQGRLTVSIHLKQWILEWWIKHINEVDYHTFRQENLVERILAKPDAWRNLIPLIKPTGVETIDAEHRNLIHLAIDWVNALQAGQDGRALLQQLEHCAREHFADEEALIERHDLPGLANQRTQHAAFLAKLGELDQINQLGGSAPLDPVEAVQLILNWWISHINDADSASFSLAHLQESLFENASDWATLDQFILPTGIGKIDAEHRAIAEKMLQLDQPLVSPTADAETHDALARIDDMLVLARHHFVDEETMMARLSVPVLRVHIDNHRAFLTLLTGYRDDLQQGRLKISKGLKSHLLTWWVRHIREFDNPAFGIHASNRSEANAAPTLPATPGNLAA